MKATLLTTVAAAALIAASGFANAQGRDPAPAGPQTAPQSAPAPQRNAPAEKIAPSPGTTGQNVDVKGGADGKAGAEIKSDSKARDAQAPGMNTTGQSGRDADKPRAGADDKSGPKARSSDNERGDADRQKTQRSGADSKSDLNRTTGQGAAGSRSQVNLTSEQKTKITTTIKQQAKPVTNVNFNVSVGTRVPREQVVTYWQPLPATVVEVYPPWRGYYFILVGGQIVIIEPSSYEIVYVMAA
jgi:hypothetical protein